MSAQSGDSEYLLMFSGSDEASSHVDLDGRLRGKLRLSSVLRATWKLRVGLG